MVVFPAFRASSVDNLDTCHGTVTLVAHVRRLVTSVGKLDISLPLVLMQKEDLVVDPREVIVEAVEVTTFVTSVDHRSISCLSAPSTNRETMMTFPLPSVTFVRKKDTWLVTVPKREAVVVDGPMDLAMDVDPLLTT